MVCWNPSHLLMQWSGHTQIILLHNQLESYVEQIPLLKTHGSYMISHMDHIAVWTIDGAPFMICI